MRGLSRDGMGRPSSSRETELSGTNGDREIFIFPVKLTMGGIRKHTRLIHTLLYVMTIHTYIHTYILSWKMTVCMY